VVEAFREMVCGEREEEEEEGGEVMAMAARTREIDK